MPTIPRLPVDDAEGAPEALPSADPVTLALQRMHNSIEQEPLPADIAAMLAAIDARVDGDEGADERSGDKGAGQ